MEAAPRERNDQALATDRDGVIRRWESACVSVFGYSREEAVGQTLDLIVPPPLQGLHWRGFNRAVASGQLKRPNKTLRVPAVHKSGRVISLQLEDTALVRGADGSVERVAANPSSGPAWVAAVSRPVLGLLGLRRRR